VSGSPTGVIDSKAHNEEGRMSLESITSSSVQTLVSSVEKVLLQTATVPMQSSDRSETISVKVLVNSASHRTFMTERLAKQLKLVSQYKEALSVSIFAARKPQEVNSYVVKFNLVTTDRCCLQLHANVLEQITGLIQRGPLQLSDMDILLVSSKIGYILTGSYLSPTGDDQQANSSLLVMTQVSCVVPALNWSISSDDSVTLNPNIEDF